MKVDNRWSSGGLDAKVPETALAAYGARWIDQGDNYRADIVPDRQGSMYDNETGLASREELIEHLISADLTRPDVVGSLDRDVQVEVFNDGHFVVWMRRAGGYIYVAAWIEP